MSESLQFQVVASFFNEIELIGLDIFKALLEPAGPRDIDCIYFRRLSETEIGSQVALREIASATVDLANLRDAVRANLHSSTHRVAIALRANQFEVHEVVPRSAAVMEQQRRIAIISHRYIHVAVIIEVGEGYTSSYVWRLKTVSARRGHFHELALAFIMKQGIDLLVGGFLRRLLDFRIHVSVGNEQVQPAIIIKIEKTSAKTEHVICRPSYAGLVADLNKGSVALVVPHMVRRLLKVVL